MMVGNVTVLLTDEKDDYTQRLASTLRNNRMDVKICPKNGVEVLRVCDEIYPDVIIMDAFLQHIDAVGVIAQGCQGKLDIGSGMEDVLVEVRLHTGQQHFACLADTAAQNHCLGVD
ncbi:MAG: hypothetical protein IJO44_08140, partial [Clostridia bacterium]|nr:hypothetical protein [Clostridia bacterium]